MSYGSQISTGIKRGTAGWNTAETLGANNLLIINSESITGGSQVIANTGLSGDAWGTQPLLGSKVVGGSLDCPFLFGNSVDLLWALAMGDGGGSPTNLGSGAYTHVLDLADSHSEYFNIAFDKIVSVHEIPSAVINSISFTAEAQSLPAVTCDIIGSDLSVAGQSLASVTSLDTTGDTYHLNLNKAKFRINARTGASLTDADVELISEFTLTLNNNFARDYTANTDCDGIIRLPTRQGQPLVTLAFTFPEYDTNKWRTGFEARTDYKIDLEFCGPAIGGGFEYSYLFQFPNCRIVEIPDNSIGGPDRLPNRVVMQAFDVASAPSGMSGVTKPFRLSITNRRSSAMLS